MDDSFELFDLRVHTRLVPDLSRLATLDRDYGRDIVETSLKRLRMERLDLVRFHWWDHDLPRYLDAVAWLNEVRVEGRVAHVGGPNFDTARTLQIVKAGVSLLSMQVQYSWRDARPERLLAQAAQDSGMWILC